MHAECIDLMSMASSKLHDAATSECTDFLEMTVCIVIIGIVTRSEAHVYRSHE